MTSGWPALNGFRWSCVLHVTPVARSEWLCLLWKLSTAWCGILCPGIKGSALAPQLQNLSFVVERWQSREGVQEKKGGWAQGGSKD